MIDTYHGQNGQPPEGYRARIHRIGPVIIGGVPREQLGLVAMFCLGAGMAFKSYGAILLYIIAHATLAYVYWREPLWPFVLYESLKYRWKLWHRRAERSETETRFMLALQLLPVIVLGSLTLGVLLIYLTALGIW